MFIRFDMIHEHDRQTDGHRMTAIAVHMHSIVKRKLRQVSIVYNYRTLRHVMTNK